MKTNLWMSAVCGLAMGVAAAEVPENADVTLPADFTPTDYGFNTHKQGMKAADFAK
jgi:hypothetical protein